eukprot:768802-Hanusia_phi.AAC.15
MAKYETAQGDAAKSLQALVCVQMFETVRETATSLCNVIVDEVHCMNDLLESSLRELHASLRKALCLDLGALWQVSE